MNNKLINNRMDFLQKMARLKRRQVETQKSEKTVPMLEKSEYFSRQPFSLSKAVVNSKPGGVIAEFKRSSPSAGDINYHSDPSVVCRDYENAGASAVSILTESLYFGGSNADLSDVRKIVLCPILRKDFIIDEYQLIEAKSTGADAVLLITELHSAGRLEELFRFAASLGLEVLVEVHDRSNIYKIPGDAVMVGINSRNLSSLNVKPEHSSDLISSLPQSVIKVAESGIRSVNACVQLSRAGFNAFLIGEYFMRSDDPGKKCQNFITRLKESLNPGLQKARL